MLWKFFAGLLLLSALIAPAAAHAAAAAPQPNILIAIADDWSYPHAGAYGCVDDVLDHVARRREQRWDLAQEAG